MWRSIAFESLLFAILVFGVMEGFLVLGREDRSFSWVGLAGSIAFGAICWFVLGLLFSRPTTWQLPETDLDWLRQQLTYLRLQPAPKRHLGPGGSAHLAPMSFHYGAELWIRPADQPGQLRIDGPRQLIRKLQTRYAKRAATSS